MNLTEARSRIAALQGESAPIDPLELESFATGIIDTLPYGGEAAAERQWAYEQLIILRNAQGRQARAVRVYRQYLADCAPPCDADYERLYHEGLAATGTPPTPLRRRDRFYSLVQMFRKTLALDGLVAECGCFRGLSSFILCRSLQLAQPAFDGKGYRIFDSFAGLSAPQAEDAVDDAAADAELLRNMTRQGQYAAPLDRVKAALAAFPGIEYFPGWIPAAFPDETGQRYRFVHVDVDIYQPTRDSIEYFYPRLVSGGILVCDDFNWPGARKAIAEICEKLGATYATTAYTQAYLIHP